MDRPVKLRDDGMRDAVRGILALRESRPEIFRRRLTEQESKRGKVDPDDGDYSIESDKLEEDKGKSNSDKLRALTEDDTDEEATFDQWKGQVYDIGRRLYGIDNGSISDEMLKFKWSQGVKPKELIMSLARKAGLEQITDPNEFE